MNCLWERNKNVKKKIYDSQNQANLVNRILKDRDRDNFQGRYEANMETVSPRYCEKNLAVMDISFEKNKSKEIVYDLLDSLEKEKGKKYRIVVEQIYFQGKTLEEVGEMLNTSKQGVLYTRKKGLEYLFNEINRKKLDLCFA